MNAENAKTYNEAWNCALRLLGRRPHGERELARKLAQRKFSEAVIARVLEEAERLQLIDDFEFAKIFLSELHGRGYGERRIRKAFFERGLDAAILERVIDESREAGESCELDRAMAAGKSKLLSLRRETDDRKRRDKLYRFLAGRGFRSDIIRKVIEKSL